MHSFLNSLCGQLPCDASESKMALAELSQWNIYGSKGPGDASYGNVYNNIVFIQRCLWCAQRLLQTLYTSSVPPVKQVGGKNESCLQMSKRNTEQDSTEVHSGATTEQETPVSSKVQGVRFISSCPHGLFRANFWFLWILTMWGLMTFLLPSSVTESKVTGRMTEGGRSDSIERWTALEWTSLERWTWTSRLIHVCFGFYILEMKI